MTTFPLVDLAIGKVAGSKYAALVTGEIMELFKDAACTQPLTPATTTVVDGAITPFDVPDASVVECWGRVNGVVLRLVPATLAAIIAANTAKVTGVSGVQTGAVTGGIPGGIPLASLSAPIAANFNYYFPFVVEEPISLTKAATEVTAAAPASSKLSVAVYAADANYQPVGAPLADFGEQLIDSLGVRTWTLGAPVALPRGRYVCLQRASGAASFRCITYVSRAIPGVVLSFGGGAPFILNHYVAAAYTAAAPNPAPAWASSNVSATAGYRPFAQLGWTVP